MDGEWDLTVSLPAEKAAVVPRLINRLLEKLHGSITRIANITVSLSRVAPELAKVASDLDAGAKSQSARATQIASVSKEMTQTVREIAASSGEAAAFSMNVVQNTSKLQAHSRDLKTIVEMIRQVAAQTQIVSLNARIEAARAGAHGDAFGVVANEMRRLAGQTKEATARVEAILTVVQQNIDQVAVAIGSDSTKESFASAKSDGNTDSEVNLHGLITQIAKSSGAQEKRIKEIAGEIEGIASITEQDAASASHLKELFSHVHQQCNELITNVGVFRLAAHRTAREVLAQISRDPELLSMDAGRQERFLRSILDLYPYFELLYVTDSAGRQITSNVSRDGFQAAYGSNGRGKNWSERPWFVGAMQKPGVYTSDVYRSVATDSFCFTVAAPLLNSDGTILGVIGADVDFSNVLAIES